jgi:hypothetical protein
MFAVGPLLLNACSALPTERQLVGTWTAPKSSTEIKGVEQAHSKQMIDFTFSPDHNFVWGLHEQRPTSAGRWQLRGRFLITEYTTPAKGHKLAYPYRDKIIKLTSQELIYVQGEDDPGAEVHLTRR